MLVKGFHGTTLAVAEALCAGSDWKFSENEGDWLGYGGYFFQDGPQRAMHWAKINAGSGDIPAVVRVDIDLTNCLDFLDLKDLKVVRDIYESIKDEDFLPDQNPLEVRRGRSKPPPGGTSLKMINKLDKFIIDYCAAYLEDSRTITTVRAPFLWGHAVPFQSFIFNWSRVEIAVRDPSAITAPKLVDVG